MKNNALMKHAAAVGIFVVVLFAVCLIWKVTITEPEVAAFHMNALKTAFPGFKGYDVASILWGGVLSFVYGCIAAYVFHGLHKNCCKLKE